MTVFLTLVGIILAVWILWLADKWGLGEGGELLFKVCIGVGAMWVAYALNLGVLGVLILLAAAALYLKYRKYRAKERAREELRRKMEGDAERGETSRRRRKASDTKRYRPAIGARAKFGPQRPPGQYSHG